MPPNVRFIVCMQIVFDGEEKWTALCSVHGSRSGDQNFLTNRLHSASLNASLRRPQQSKYLHSMDRANLNKVENFMTNTYYRSIKVPT